MSNLSTEPYKGVRDFYPEEMSVQQYIFDIWGKTAESFGFQRYEASVLEPAELYKAKGVENEEMVNDQTYTFTDRGDREVTLRPEMTPTVARMIAAKRKELAFPVRWYSIPNLFRYERTQRGRVREHWQWNCDIFGSDSISADIELIALAYQALKNFGATPEMFEIRINNRVEMKEFYRSIGITSDESVTEITRLNDKFHKIEREEYLSQLKELVGEEKANIVLQKIVGDDGVDTNPVLEGLKKMGINNVRIDRSLARGFDYYTGTIFEVFDTDSKNNRSMLGGGRYDNLTSLFGGDPVCGVGFGMGDVTMKDFLETHDLLKLSKKSAQMIVIPTEESFNIDAEKVATEFRDIGVSAMVDISGKKLGKKISAAAESTASYMMVIGEDEISRQEYVIKNLADGTESSGTISDLAKQFSV